MAVHVAQMTGRKEVMACFDMVTRHAARTLGVEERYGLEVGKPADFIVVDAPDAWDALRRLATVTTVVKGGRVIAEATPPEVRLLGEKMTFQR
jgi:cytosine deaminase